MGTNKRCADTVDRRVGAGGDQLLIPRTPIARTGAISSNHGVRPWAYSCDMFAPFSFVDLLSLAVSIAALAFTVAIFLLGRRLTFRERRSRARELEKKAWKVLGPIRTEGLNSKVIVMNVARHERGHDGSNELNWRGYAYEGHEIIEIVHDGVEVVVKGVESWYDDEGKRTLTETMKRAPNVVYVGHIPWEWIEDIAPRGDEFDGSAIFFVRHRAPGRRPFDFVTFREGSSVPIGPHNRAFFMPVPELGTLRPSWVRDWWSFFKQLRAARRMERARRSVLGR